MKNKDIIKELTILAENTRDVKLKGVINRFPLNIEMCFKKIFTTSDEVYQEFLAYWNEYDSSNWKNFIGSGFRFQDSYEWSDFWVEIAGITDYDSIFNNK